jgi:hypothetical protein
MIASIGEKQDVWGDISAVGQSLPQWGVILNGSISNDPESGEHPYEYATRITRGSGRVTYR